MERWLKAAVAAVPVDEQKALDRVTAIKAEMSRLWDEAATRDDMLARIEKWLAYGAAPAGVKGCMLREELYPIMEAVYKEEHPEDFAEAKFEERIGEVVGGGK